MLPDQHAMPLLLWIALAATLPGFEDFRRADLERRQTGVWETLALRELTRVSTAAVANVATKRPQDALVQWGAAELLPDWPSRQRYFESALALSGSNTMIALRFTAAAVHAGQGAAAEAWLRYCQRQDPSNAVPWIVEAAWWRQRDVVRERLLPAGAGTEYRDGASEAARARIRVLELVGYSPYAARRLGYSPELPVLAMARQLPASDWSRRVARAMQRGPTFLVTELAGQSLENALEPTPERTAELKERREALLALTARVGEAVDTAREDELVRYFDDMLLLGEEEALKRLWTTVRGGR